MSEPKFGDVFRFGDSTYSAVVMYLGPALGGWKGLVLESRIDYPGDIEDYLPMEEVEGWTPVEGPMLMPYQHDFLRKALQEMSTSDLKNLWEEQVTQRLRTDS